MLSITSKCYCSSSIHRRRSSNIDLAVVRRITSLTSWSHNQQHSSTNIIATTKKRFYSINNDQLTLLYHRHVRINTTNNKNVTNRRLFFTNEQQSISNGSNSTTSSSNIFRRYPITFTLITFTIGITGYSIKYIHDHISGGTLEGLQRSIIFYSFGIPKYILYRYYMYMKPNNDTFWDQLNSATSSEGLDIILKLQGFYIKCGQLCASNIGNSFPIIWQNTMSILQDQCPYQDYNNVITNIIKDEYNITNISDIFEYIDPIPIGAASIGQVHRALLKVPIDYNVDKDNINSNSSRKITKFNNNNNMNKKYKTIPVVIKICYPNAERLLRGDVCTIKAFAQIAQPVHVPGIIEMEKQFATEFDYIIEGKHLQLVRTNLINASLCYNNDNNASNNGNKNTICTIPKPYLKYCTKRILIMEELHGDKLIVALRKNVNKLAKLAGYTNVEEFINDNIQQEKQHRNTSLVVDDVKSNIKERNNIQSFYRYIQLYDTIRNGLYHWTIGIIMKPFLKQNNNTDDIDWPLLNHAKLIDDLIYIHGHEVLVDGVFNSDPHPGNILLCRNPNNGQPQLGLIDYGQVKKLNKETRHLFAKLIIALANENYNEIINIMKVAGYQSKYMNSHNIYLYAKVYYDEDNISLTNGLHIQMFVENLQSLDPIYQLPTEFISIGRTSIVLRGLAHSLNESRSIAKAWKPIAERVLLEDI